MYFMKEFVIEFMLPFVGLIMFCIGLFIGAIWVTVWLETDTMKQLGFNTKQVNFECIAEYQGKWIRCTDAKWKYTYNY